jgi:hypothetical protein
VRDWQTGQDNSVAPPNNGQIMKPTAQRQDVVDWFQTILHRDPTDQEIQKYVGGDTSQMMQDLRQLQPAVSGQPPPAATPPPGSSTSGTPIGGILSPFAEPFAAPTPQAMPDAPTVTDAPAPNLPTFKAAAPFTPTKWKAPTIEEAASDPGFKFSQQQAQAGIQNWAAAKGTLNDSSTAKALSDYGVNSAAGQYQNVWNRDFSGWQANNANDYNAYETNYQTQTLDPYKFAYQSALDANAPATATWSARNNANLAKFTTMAPLAQQQNQFNYSSAFNKWLADWQMSTDNRDSTYNKLFQTLTS